jgi:hypothetical protein
MPATKMDLSAPWYAPPNYNTARSPAAYYCFSREPSGGREVITNLVAVTGPGTAFDPIRNPRWDSLPPDLIVIIESGTAGVHWAEPGDLDVRAIGDSVTDGVDGTGVLIGFADGQVWFLDREIPLKDLREFMTIRGAQQSDRACRLAPYRMRIR